MYLSLSLSLPLPLSLPLYLSLYLSQLLFLGSSGGGVECYWRASNPLKPTNGKAETANGTGRAGCVGPRPALPVEREQRLRRARERASEAESRGLVTSLSPDSPATPRYVTGITPAD